MKILLSISLSTYVFFFIDDYQPINLDVQDRFGSTPLMSAIEFGNLSIVNFLLHLGVNVWITNHKMRNCLHTAALSGFLDFDLKMD